MKYPQYTNNQAGVIVTTKSGNRCRAMFYWNGGKPTFASFGSDITEHVIDWEYDPTPNRAGPNEQIKQLAEDISKHVDDLATLAEKLYAMGYRRQIEAEWIENKKVCSSPYCSHCGAIGDKSSYCHHCGAIMKGELP